MLEQDLTTGRDGQVLHVTATGVFRYNLTPVGNHESAVFYWVSEYGTRLG